ncbi:MAG: hypothetical protein BGO34_03275 [Bacteroidia bacterium 44-10]|nr:MAG: hypothetical protein BGO34_03275 [Bacteroidia bacterium 44-10]
MPATYDIKILVNLFLWLSSSFLPISCLRQSNARYPAHLEEMIHLFFIENQNDSILHLEDTCITHLPENVRQVSDIFKAAALCESGRADSAEIILQGIRPELLDARGLYYYNGITALTRFRLNHLQEAYQTAIGVVESNVYDARCLALVERLMARIHYYYENYEHAISLLHRSSEHYREAGLHKSVAVNQKFLASYYNGVGSFDEAIKKIGEAETTLKKYDDKEELYYVYIVAINAYLNLQQMDSTQYYAKLAMETADFTHDQQKQASIYNYMGRIESLQGNWPAAIASFERVIRTDNEYFGSERRKSGACIGLASIYNKLGKHEEAKEYAMRAIGPIREHDWENWLYYAYTELSTAFQSTDPAKAQLFLDSAQISQDKYHRLFARGIVNFTETQIELDQAARRIEQLQNDKRRNRNIFHVAFLLLVLSNIIVIRVNKRRKKKKQAKPHIIMEQKESGLFNDFEVWLEEGKKFLQPGLDLNRVAMEMGTNRSYLSKAINSQGVRFTEIINRYRIREVIRIFENKDDPRHHLNTDELSCCVGFRTKSVFFDSFRRETGMTPRQFRENIRYTKTPDAMQKSE